MSNKTDNNKTPTKKQNLAAFKCKLQDNISLDDRAWKYQVPGLPSARELDQRRLVKTVSLINTRERHEIVLTLETAEDNRAIRADPLNKFLVVSLAEFRHQLSTLSSETRSALQPTTPRECTEYAVKLLKAGIFLQGVHYNFYGHSNSQLKSRTCFLYAAPRDDISRKVESLGNFAKMKTVAKKAKRIGLLFSTAKVATAISPDRVEDIPDVESADYIFTDGCGLVAPRLAQELARRVRIVFRGCRYTPSVFQIRYRGYKGVVTVDPTMTADKSVLLKMRKSMKKFAGGDDHSFSVVEYSKPYTYGFLNDEVIILLNALGVSRDVIRRKQEEHFQFLADATREPRAAFRFLSFVNMPRLAERVLVDSLESVQPRIHALVKNEYAKMLNKKDEQKCRVLISKSRLLFGVCDAWGVLKEGECAVKITLDGDGQPAALRGCEVLVTRNPCLHPGDMQKFKVVEKHELAHLVDCIVFSTQGKRPAADMMSGGDLDGDTFFVTWDEEIIPSTLSQPAHYPGVKEPLRFNPITDDDRLEYFARYTNASLGRVKNLYLDWVRACGPMASQCQELNRLFSQCVDGNRIRIPRKLENAPQPSPDARPFILDELHDAARLLIQKASMADRRKGLDGYNLDAVELLLSREDVAMSEFELLRIVSRWCRKNGTRLEDSLPLFDLNVLTAEEKTWILGQLPPLAGVPAMVLNAVCSSNLLSEDASACFQLNHHNVHWKRIFDSTSDRLGTFLDTASSAMGIFHRKLLVLRVDERLTLVVYVPKIIEQAQDCVVDDTVRLFAFPHSQGTETQSRMSLPTKMTYRLYCDEKAFQLFEGQRGNTWIYIARGPLNDSSYRNTENVGDRRRQRQETLDSGQNFDYRVSIALDKFSRGLQRHVGRVNRNGLSAAEIYVISNRDVKSIRTLDLWLQHIDTETRLPLFEDQAEEYTVPTMKDVDWESEAATIIEIARHRNFSAFKAFSAPDQFEEAFTWLIERDQKQLLHQVFQYLLSTLRNGGLMEIAPQALLLTMIKTLRPAPFLAINFGRMEPVEQSHEQSEELKTFMDVYSMDILRAYILCANEAGDLVAAPFQRFLAQVSGLTFSNFAELVELVALTVREPDIAMDILLGGLEHESARLLSGRPALVRHFVQNTIATALNHIGESKEQAKTRDDLLELKLLPEDRDGYQIVEVVFRIDTTGGTPENAAHVRLTAASAPANSPLAKTPSMDALVIHSEQGLARLQCFHPLPPHYDRCRWKLKYCGPFTTAKTMLDGVRDFATYFGDCCQVANQLLLGATSGSLQNLEIESRRVLPDYPIKERLNDSQNAAVQAALNSDLTCLWGPPGTGKTETIVEIIRALQISYDKPRILVTAPTHNAVDNVMRRYLGQLSTAVRANNPHLAPLRVSTEIRKVAEDLRKHTCDAMVGQEIYRNRQALDEAKRRVQECSIIFTTCIGSGLGLLRSQLFDIVIVDEASQQTEPESLVPLIKGCQKAVLVGDHVQLRPTVHQHALAMGFDRSLFERLFDAPDTTHVTDSGNTKTKSPAVARLMLDTQYRMHPSICTFSSTEFYADRLRTGIPATARPLFQSAFPWPSTNNNSNSSSEGRDFKSRMVFIPCSTPEDLGSGKSKTNRGQAELCLRICRLLLQPAKPSPSTTTYTTATTIKPSTTTATNKKETTTPRTQPPPQSIAILTPYARQAELLKRLLSPLSSSSSSAQCEVSSIDGFQGREADIVVLVTVRCNAHGEIGFLRDARRVNVALTRARAGVVVVGCRETLTGFSTPATGFTARRDGEVEGGEGGTDGNGKELWRRLVGGLDVVGLDGEAMCRGVRRVKN